MSDPPPSTTTASGPVPVPAAVQSEKAPTHVPAPVADASQKVETVEGFVVFLAFSSFLSPCSRSSLHLSSQLGGREEDNGRCGSRADPRLLISGRSFTLMIDNYDSFSYNLYQYLEQLGANVRVVRNDKITIEEIQVSGRALVAG